MLILMMYNEQNRTVSPLVPHQQANVPNIGMFLVVTQMSITKGWNQMLLSDLSYHIGNSISNDTQPALGKASPILKKCVLKHVG